MLINFEDALIDKINSQEIVFQGVDERMQEDDKNIDDSESLKNIAEELAKLTNAKWQNNTSLCALIVSIIALGISIWGVVSSNNNDKEVSRNEIEQAHEAIIKIWDQEIDMIIDIDTLITDEMSFEYSNIGDGLAQDIKFEILPEEQISIAVQCEDLLDACLTGSENVESHTWDYAHYLSPDIGDNSTFSFWYDVFDGEVQELRNFDIFGEHFSFDSSLYNSKAYLLPVSMEDRKTNFVLSRGLSLLIFNTFLTLEYYEEPLENPITFNIQLSYKDVLNNITEDKVTVELSLIDGPKNTGAAVDNDSNIENSPIAIRIQVTVHQDILDSGVQELYGVDDSQTVGG